MPKKDKHYYVYYGDVKDIHNNKYEMSDETFAKSPQEALKNIQFKFKKELGLDPSAKIYLDKDSLYLMDKEKDEKCPICGRELNQIGECPYCNEWDYPDYLEEELLDHNVHYFTSPYECKNYLFSRITPQRIYIDLNVPMYLVAEAYDLTHMDMIEEAIDSAIVSRDYFWDDYDSTQIALIYNPNSYTQFSEQGDAIDDNYDYKYIYDEFVVYSRYQDFSEFKLASILGDYEIEKLEESLKESQDQQVDSLGNNITQEQIKYFKNSKIRDNQGHLLVCYHGTMNGKFDTFEMGRYVDSDEFAWFSTNKEYTKNYSNDGIDGIDSYTFSVYLNVENPFNTGDTHQSVYEDDGETPTKYVIDLANRLNVDVEELIELGVEETPFGTELFDITRTSGFRDILEERGYDGQIANEFGNMTIGVMYPEQIKATDNLNPTKSPNINEELGENSIYVFPNSQASIDYYWKDRKASVERVSIKKLVDDNNLLDDDDLQSYHQKQWDNKPATEFSINKDKANMWRMSETPYVVRKKDGKLELGDGRHRIRALYNDGYEYVELPVLEEKIDLDTEISPTNNFSQEDDKSMGLQEKSKNKGNLNEAIMPMNNKFRRLTDECIDLLGKNGLIVPDNLKVVTNDNINRLGVAYYPKSENDGNYMIGISNYLKDMPDEQIKNTIYHELGHILAYEKDFAKGYVYLSGGDTWLKGNTNSERRANKKRLSHHGKVWQDIMKQISQITGQEYSRLANAEDTSAFKDATKDKYIYHFECPNCHVQMHFARKTDFVKNYDKDGDDGVPMWCCHDCRVKTGKRIKFVKLEGSK